MKVLSKIADRVSCESSICELSIPREHVDGSMLRIEVQRLAESTSSSEKFEPRDVHELCGPHDAESCSAERNLGDASGGEWRRDRGAESGTDVAEFDVWGVALEVTFTGATKKGTSAPNFGRLNTGGKGG